MEDRQNQETTETNLVKEYSVKNLFHSVDCNQLAEEFLLKWVVRVINLGVLSLILNVAG